MLWVMNMFADCTEAEFVSGVAELCEVYTEAFADDVYDRHFGPQVHCPSTLQLAIAICTCACRMHLYVCIRRLRSGLFLFLFFVFSFSFFFTLRRMHLHV